jgi:hypothetical protein
MAKAKSTEADRVTITSEVPDEDIVAFDKEGVRFQFSADDMRELPEDLIRGLSRENAMDYFLALGEKRARDRAAKQNDGAKSGRVEYVRSPFDGISYRRMQTKPAKGMHNYWADPREVELRKSYGYTVVTDPSAASHSDFTGDQHRLMTDEGKVDLVLMQVPDALYQQHIQAMSDQSHAKLAVNDQDEVKEAVEVANRKRGGRKKAGIRIIDESGTEA